MADLAAEATFTNPTDTSQFEYGFVIRERDGIDRIAIFVASDGDWEVVVWARTEYRNGSTVYEAASQDWGSLDVPLDTSDRGENHVRITAMGERVCLFVNGEDAACVDLPDFTMAGEVSISSGYGSVSYRGFKVTALEEADQVFPEFYISLAASDNRPSPLKPCEEALVTTGAYGIPVGTTGASLFRSADGGIPGRS